MLKCGIYSVCIYHSALWWYCLKLGVTIPHLRNVFLHIIVSAQWIKFYCTHLILKAVPNCIILDVNNFNFVYVVIININNSLRHIFSLSVRLAGAGIYLVDKMANILQDYIII